MLCTGGDLQGFTQGSPWSHLPPRPGTCRHWSKSTGKGSLSLLLALLGFLEEGGAGPGMTQHCELSLALTCAYVHA